MLISHEAANNPSLLKFSITVSDPEAHPYISRRVGQSQIGQGHLQGTLVVYSESPDLDRTNNIVHVEP
ncbi:hypothetical protein C2W62_08865 [Candidatus Entotheonella serta]|nr:hypothetical protein C2W62_08865 [Candidatus Entotheonella serta]